MESLPAGGLATSESGMQDAVDDSDADLVSRQNRKESDIGGLVGWSAAAASFGPMHFESGCGVKIRGGKLADAFSHSGVRLDPIDDWIVRVWFENVTNYGTDIAPVALVFQGGSGILVPVMSGFIAALTVEDGEVVEVAYEPVSNSYRWHGDGRELAEVRALRTIVAQKARDGIFRIDGEDVSVLARRMQVVKGIDPAFALYAAYAYHQQHRVDRINEMRYVLQSDIGASFFDLELLAGALSRRANMPVPSPGVSGRIMPPFPMLAQGWALLPAFGVQIPQALEALRGELVDGLWTQFTARGMSHLRLLMQQGDLG